MACSSRIIGQRSLLILHQHVYSKQACTEQDILIITNIFLKRLVKPSVSVPSDIVKDQAISRTASLPLPTAKNNVLSSLLKRFIRIIYKEMAQGNMHN
jgi:hypothetical protein